MRPGGPTGNPGGNTGGNPGGNPGGTEDKGDGTLNLKVHDHTLVLTLEMQLNPDANVRIAISTRWAMQMLKSEADLTSTRVRYYDLARGLTAYYKEKGEFPQGTVARGENPTSGVPYPPDQRLSFYTALLPYLGPEVAEWKLDPSRSWNEEMNLKFATRILPPVLAHRLPGLSLPFVIYPRVDSFVGATHFVGVAGLGMDAAEYLSGTPATAAKAGIFGYDRVTKKADIKDGLDKTIALLMVPADHKAPWLAGGGSTVRAVADEAEDANPLAPFVCTTYPAKPGEPSKMDGKRGTLAIMADGKVRFIPFDLDPKTFRALCTIAGGEKIEKLDTICPVLEDPADRELKADTKPIVVPGGPATPGTPIPVGANDDQKAIQGTWKVVGGLSDGNKLTPDELAARLEFTDNKLVLTEAGKSKHAGYRLDPSKSPKHLDLLAPPGTPGVPAGTKVNEAIYELSGDKLQIYYVKPPTGALAARPSSMSPPAGGGLVTHMILERVK